jgi:hypothetical protein
MGVDKFKFVSPGIFVNEIDESAMEPLPPRMGPLVIGRFQKGPANRPVVVESFKEFVATFGGPSDGVTTGDSWRTGEMTAPTYAAYAAQAWLKNNSPCTIYRVLGENRTEADTDAGKAGWKLTNDFSSPTANAEASGGGYGMFIIPSASSTTHVTGTLAAIWYVDAGGVVLSGTARDGAARQGAGVWIADSAGAFTAKISGSGGVLKTATFDFDVDSKKFIRKVFNTEPSAVNSNITPSDDVVTYWLGETFESNVTANKNSQLRLEGDLWNDGQQLTSTNKYAVILALDGTNSGNNVLWGDHKKTATAAQTGYFFSQDIRGTYVDFDATNNTHVKQLFRFIALDSGESANRELKISIQDIKMSSNKFNDFGTFTVLVRRATDTDNAPEVLERYSNVNLNPKSSKYIARVIGDRNYNYDADNKVLNVLGNYENKSKYIRVDVTDDVKNGRASQGWLPYGVYGPVVPQQLTVLSGTTSGITNGWIEGAGALPNSLILEAGADGITGADSGSAPIGSADLFWVASDAAGEVSASSYVGQKLTASFQWPKTRLRASSSEGDIPKGSNAYFGYQSNLKGTKRFDKSNVDILRGQPANLSPHAKTAALDYSWVFTLDDIREDTSDTSHATWLSGSRKDNLSYTALSGSGFVLTGSGAGYNRFTSPMFGGLDGLDLKEKDPFRNAVLSSTQGEVTNYAYYSLKKAVDLTSDAEFVEYDLIAMPGVNNTSLNTQLISSCEERGDAMAVVDLDSGYIPGHNTTATEENRLGSVADAVNNVDALGINSSYGCTFYPWVQIRDSISDSILYVPPSVVALGTFSSSQRKSAVWFAPAGFTRGGLSEGSSGLPVVGVRARLTSDDRDKLYDANINPIASFPAEGIVIFGQKTLQVTDSALDRINVRRLLIHVKKEVSRMAATTLFEQNVSATWDKFKGRVIPFLESVQAGLGLTDFKVMLDDTTTTPDLIDRNILYAKIYLKPARAIEFIALDFIITKTGASFDD